MLSYFFFTSPKSNFITYNIPFYNTSYIKKLYYFTFSLKYYFLIFFYYFFSIITFFQDSKGNIFLGFRTFFFFFPDLYSPTVTFSWAMQHYFYSNSDVDSSGLSLAFIISFQQWCFFKWRYEDTENEEREGNWSTRQWREKFRGGKRME